MTAADDTIQVIEELVKEMTGEEALDYYNDIGTHCDVAGMALQDRLGLLDPVERVQ